jgi:transposase-like protein
MDPIDMAIIWLRSQKTPNVSEAARKFEVNRSTLSKRFRGIQLSRKQFTSISKKHLTDTQEEEILAYINNLTQRGIPPTHPILENLVVEVLGAPIEVNWTHSFVARHHPRVQSKYLQPFDVKRIKADKKEYYFDFYELVSIQNLLLFIYKLLSKLQASFEI